MIINSISHVLSILGMRFYYCAGPRNALSGVFKMMRRATDRGGGSGFSIWGTHERALNYLFNTRGRSDRGCVRGFVIFLKKSANCGR